MTTPLVVFGEDWGAHPSSTQHLMQRLIQQRQVVWVNSIGLRRPRPNIADIGRLIAKGKSAFFPSNRVPVAGGQDIKPAAVISPFSIPVPKNSFERNFNRTFLGGKIRRVLKKLPRKKPILWASLPTAIDLLGCADERAVVYYCGDDFSGLAGVDHKAVAKAEEKMAKRADLILVASRHLAKKFPQEKTVHLPHGVDIDLFSAPRHRPEDLPLDRPVAGFYGSISDWLDVEMMHAVALRLPTWQFVFIGQIQTDISLLNQLENITFLGPRKHRDLPAYVQNWTVSLLPFRDNAQIRACNPLKLREYLAAGTPIVSTDFPALDGYRDLISVASQATVFAQSITDVLNEPGDKRRLRRERIAAESWDSRAEEVSKLLANLA